MGNQKQIEEVARETSNKQWQRRDEYCLRIQKAMQYKGNDDHEDVWSILVDYEMEIKQELIPEDAMVITREEYEQYEKCKGLLAEYMNGELISENVFCQQVEDIKQIHNETADRYYEEINKSIECIPNMTRGVIETLKIENKRILFEVKSNLL